MDNRWKQAKQILLIGAVLALIWVGFWLRLLYVERPYYHPDEYVSMLAAQAVAEHGVPVLPSGLFYDPEIAFSYFSGLFVRLLGASLSTVRWASLFFGVLSIPMAYVTARRIFSSPLAGVAAATFLAAAPDAVLWSGRARRYAMGEFLILLILLLIWRGAVEGNNRKYRIFFYVVCVVAGLTFLQALVVLPPLLLAVLVVTWRTQPISSGILKKHNAIEAILIVLTLAGLYLRATFNFAVHMAEMRVAGSLQDVSASSVSKVAAALSPFLFPTFSLPLALAKIHWQLVSEPLYQVLAIPVLLAITLSLVPNFDRTGKYRRAVWFLLIIAGGVLFEFLFIISQDWLQGRARYLFVTLWPAFIILACGAVVGLERLARRWHPPARFPQLTEWAFVPVKLSLLAAVLAVTLPNTSAPLKTMLGDEVDYPQAFQFVADHWQPGDQVMTNWPAASYWYLGRTDYYAQEKSADVFRNSKSEMVDMWIGAHWVSNPEELDAALRKGQVWFVTDKDRLQEEYSRVLRQQILARMELVFKGEANQAYVFLPKAKPVIIPSQPDVQVEARLAGQVELTGFSLDQAALLRGAPAQLTLFWKALQPMDDYKVFVHLRDRNGRTVAQADHIPSEALVALPTSTWLEGKIVPDVSYLQVPADTPPGEYQLLVGMYNADTMERLAVEGDTTGENAVVVTTLRRP
jgi:4-amino-4-deoxy-L-arabinose transferase-like glycosyltransferase